APTTKPYAETGVACRDSGITVTTASRQRRSYDPGGVGAFCRNPGGVVRFATITLVWYVAATIP
ncbi:MAG: hypothetical protein OQL08_09985, partial [Gammaproteobacteria bacterium]|nr:hypothetical protein [Gammaproteobacteria bacterium]